MARLSCESLDGDTVKHAVHFRPERDLLLWVRLGMNDVPGACRYETMQHALRCEYCV